ncbi:MAG TPA: sigma-70 family RNA polymerase sigma factor [Rubrivivax sp.]|jgi:RNA polymerase sigma-70 factor (ECF subfamily)|nr:sigma-70 family RNA polymerase sigma factor [Rubrivivax sp.]
MDTAPRTPMHHATPLPARGLKPSTLSVVAPDWREGHLRSMPTSDEMNDLALAVANSRDRQAFAVLFKHFAPRVKAYLLRAGSAPQVAEELAQETMVSVWRKAESFDPQRAQLSTWIFTIARNLRVDRHRREGAAADNEVVLESEHEQIPGTGATAEEQLCAARRERSVRQALAQLPDDQAMLLRLSFFEDRPHGQIASELNMPLGTVKSRMRRAVQQLRRMLDTIESP